MLFHARMDVNIPVDLDTGVRDELVAREKAYAEDLQRQGKWVHLWRIVGEYANFSVFDVETTDELHRLLSGLPLYKYMSIKVTPLATHPSEIKRKP